MYVANETVNTTAVSSSDSAECVAVAVQTLTHTHTNARTKLSASASLLISRQPLLQFSCAVPAFFCCASNHNNIYTHKKEKKNISTHPSQCLFTMLDLAVPLGRFPLTTIFCFSPFFSPLCAASALTGKSTLLLFILKRRRAAWLVCSNRLDRGCLPKLHLKKWLCHRCNLTFFFFFFFNAEHFSFVWLTLSE